MGLGDRSPLSKNKLKKHMLFLSKLYQVIVATIPLAGALARRANKLQSQLMTARDQRVGVLAEAFPCIRVLAQIAPIL